MLPTIVVGVDPQTGSQKGTGTGIAIFRNRSGHLGNPKWKLEKLHLALPHKNTDLLYMRLGVMLASINSLLNKELYNRHNQVQMVIEDPIPIIRHKRAAVALSKVIGGLQGIAHSHGYQYEEVSIRDWRKNCGVGTGRGWSREVCKMAIMNWFERMFKTHSPNIDCTEAAGIGWYRVSRLILEEKKACGT